MTTTNLVPLRPADYVQYDAPPHLDKDFYKVGHVFQYPPKTEIVYSNLTARDFKHAAAKLNQHWDGKVVTFGIQQFVCEYLQRTWNAGFFDRPWEHVEYEYRFVVDPGLGDIIPTEHLQALHKLGYLPIEIRGLEEGTRTNPKIPLLTIHNTLPEFYWLTNALETVLSQELWGPITAATIAYNYRQTTLQYAELNGSSDYMVPWQCHDFSSRGILGRMGSRLVGTAHLSSFCGTDTLSAIWAAHINYDADPNTQTVGGSVPATEHSVMCIDGSENEFNTYQRMLDLYPKGIVSIVSDTYDLWQVLTVFAPALKDQIMARLGRVVFRPDSGDPLKIICGTLPCAASLSDAIRMLASPYGRVRVFCREQNAYFRITFNMDGKLASTYELKGEEVTPEERGAYRLLYDTFGGTVNAKGYIDIDTHVGLIYGDSITPQLYDAILARLTSMGFSHSNLVVGVGSYTYQYVTRDTFGMAVKATYGSVAGIGRNIIKNPKTDDGVKKSATGVLAVVPDPNNRAELILLESIMVTPNEVFSGSFDSGALTPIFRNGVLVRKTTLEEIRNRLGWSALLQ
jgi:nicotinamide phosphoribosyltransferase